MQITSYNDHHEHSKRSSLLKRFIKITIIFSLLCTFIDQVDFLGVSLANLFMTNTLSITNYYIWQPLTSIFLLPMGPISLGTLFDLFAPIYFLYTFGKGLENILGRGRFLFLYLFAGIVASLSSLLVMHYTGDVRSISCATSAILGLCTVWSMSLPYQNSFAFLLFPLSGQFVIIVALCGTLCAELLQRNFPAATSFAAAFLASYLIGVFLWGFKGPIKALWPLEDFIKRSFRIVKSRMKWIIQVGIIGRLRRLFSKNNDIIKYH